MDGVGTGIERHGDDLLDVEVRRRSSPGQCHRLVGDLRVQRVGVVGRRHGDRVDAQPCRGPGDADGDLTPIGDQQARG
jgi:hypothetical protein